MSKVKKAVENAAENIETQENDLNVDQLIADFNELKASHEETVQNNEALITQIEQLKLENEALKESLEELNEELAKVTKESEAKNAYPLIKVGKEVFELRVPKFITRKDGKNITVTKEVLEADPDLLRTLVAKGSNIIVKKGG